MYYGLFVRIQKKTHTKKIIHLTRAVSDVWPQFIPLTNTSRADSILTQAEASYLDDSQVLQIESNCKTAKCFLSHTLRLDCAREQNGRLKKNYDSQTLKLRLCSSFLNFLRNMILICLYYFYCYHEYCERMDGRVSFGFCFYMRVL